MTSLKRKQSGFTIIELLIVIIVIGILATLVITTFSGIQRNARNRAREADINAIQGQVEYYYGQNDEYPTLANMNDATFRSDNLQGLDAGALSDPSNPDVQTLVAAPVAGSYAYAVTTEDGDACDNAATATACTKYTLTATYEGTGTYVKSSLN